MRSGYSRVGSVGCTQVETGMQSLRRHHSSVRKRAQSDRRRGHVRLRCTIGHRRIQAGNNAASQRRLQPYNRTAVLLPRATASDGFPFLFSQDKSKLPNEATEMSGCVFCTAAFAALVEKHRAVASKPVMTRGRGHVKSRNRGKPKPPKDKMAQLAAYFV